MRECAGCNTCIDHKPKNARYCSNECWRVPRFYGTYCNFCDAELYIRPNKKNRVKYCTIGCSKRSRMRQRYPNFKEDYFSDCNLQNSYWAGFIAADGSISDLKGSEGRLSIGLKSTDASHLEALRDAIGAGEVNFHEFYDDRTQKVYYRATYAITSSQVCSDLKSNFNIHPRKSLTHEPPALRGRLAYAFIAGYIDGDGSYKYAGNRPELSIAGTTQFLEWVSSVTQVKSSIHKQGAIHVAYYRGDNAILLREKYRAFDLPFLKRKINRWESLSLNLKILNGGKSASI